ncbi:MAG: preprotein translocase subunit SecG [Burkholderiaceae bacterium]
MNLMLNVVVALQIVAALVMIGLVLIQHGKGADMGASFGSGASGSLFGATGSANFLSRFTAICAAVFFVSTLGLAHLSSQRTVEPGGSGSVLDRAGAVPAPAASAIAPVGAAQVPAASGVATPAPPVVPLASSPAAPSASGAGAVPR